MPHCQNSKTDLHCKLCNSKNIILIKSSDLKAKISSKCFAVTDYNYGKTAAIFKCRQCGLLQCSNLENPLFYYEGLEDQGYEESRNERLLQMKNILKIIENYKRNGSMLDIGAASGALVELALRAGYLAKGIDPSKAFCLNAAKRNVPVYHGVFPHPQINEKFDVITLIDVIEHVHDPVTLLRDISNAMKDNGIGILVTPDVASFAARIMGWKWWHFRVSHINYFNRATLFRALQVANLVPILVKRPAWFFTVDYLFERVMNYLPSTFHLSCPNVFSKITLPLNLFDSLLVVFTKRS